MRVTMSGKCVAHRRFGEGVVKSCEKGVIQVLFKDDGARRFHYPEAFERFLTTDDPELSERAQEDLGVWKIGQQAEDARVIQLCMDRVREGQTKKPVKSKPTKAKTAVKKK
jgi:hypothetical protein